jgi:hypothetical protein
MYLQSWRDNGNILLAKQFYDLTLDNKSLTHFDTSYIHTVIHKFTLYMHNACTYAQVSVTVVTVL